MCALRAQDCDPTRAISKPHELQLVEIDPNRPPPQFAASAKVVPSSRGSPKCVPRHTTTSKYVVLNNHEGLNLAGHHLARLLGLGPRIWQQYSQFRSSRASSAGRPRRNKTRQRAL